MAEPEPESDQRRGENFPSFPFPPYDIQLGFMKALYTALDKGGVGLFESPTGTGKTLSLICGSLTWLQDIRERERLEAEAAAAAKELQGKELQGHGGAHGENEDDVPAWMADFASQQEEQRKKQEEEDRVKRIAKAKAKLLPKPAKIDNASVIPGSGRGDDGEFLLEEVDDLEEDAIRTTRKRRPGGIDPLLLLSDSDEDDEDTLPFGEAEQPEPPQKIQIIFCSRTHSQLTQFVGELHRTPFADVMSLVALGSRRALCINDDVLRLKVPGLINERCLELQKPPSARKKITDTISATSAGDGPGGVATSRNKKSSKASSSSAKCSFLAAGTKSADITRDLILAQPIDIEALATLGRKRSVCPYYASRRATPEADVILAPYSALLVEDTRKALGLKIEGNVIIVDEAHNLADAINGSHSAELHASTAETAHRQLAAYFDRFRTQLAPVNARNVQALMRAADALAKSAGGGGGGGATMATSTSSAPAKAVTVNDFLFSTSLDNVNMFQLVRHVKQSKAVFKVAGFYQALQRRTAAAAAAEDCNAVSAISTEGATGCLHALVSFLQALTNNDADGRVVSDPSSGTVKFVLLNAATHFASVVSTARAVVLASGTLSPLETVLDLFPGVSEKDIHKYSCGHVVGKERLLAVAVGAGPGGTALDFRHGSRGSHETINELGRLVLNTCTAAPGGVVVFFPSFSYADQVHARWATSGMLRTLGERKQVFREPRTAGEVDSVLEEYAACIENARSNVKPTINALNARSGTSQNKKCTGAVMLCVVGGKLAEGINFGDDLGRCVIMVGLPYPNPSDPELQERLRFVDRNSTAASNNTNGTAASREYYSNLCMKAVNQCIGRAIRHRGDYAAVLLVDVRYAAGTVPSVNGNSSSGGGQQFTGVLAKLPGWIQQSLVACPKFGDAYGRLVRFYKGMAAAAMAETGAAEAND